MRKRERSVTVFAGRQHSSSTCGGSLVCIASAIAVLSSASLAHAEPASEQVVLQELFLAETADPQEKHELQATTGFEWHRAGDVTGYTLPLRLELGVSDRLQLELGLPLVWLRGPEDTSGAGSAEMSVLYNLHRAPSSGLVLSAGLELAFPSFSAATGEAAYVAEPFVAASRPLGPVYVNMYGAIAVAVADQAATETEGEVALAVYRPVASVVPVLEMALELGDEQTNVRLAAGLRWQPKDELEIGLGVSIAASNPSDRSLLFAFTWEREFNDDDDDDDDTNANANANRAATPQAGCTGRGELATSD